MKKKPVPALDSNSLKSDIQQVCSSCGIAANVTTCLYRYGMPPKQLAFTVSTFHMGVCDWCKEEKFITEVRDFFYPDFTFLYRAREIFNRKKKNHE